MLKTIGGIAAGIIVAMATILLVQLVGHTIYPTSEFDMRDKQAVAAMIATLPTGALLFVAAAWLIGAFAGGAVAARLSGRRWTAWLIGALVALSGIANILMYPHPVWMQIAAVVAPVVGGLLAGRLVRPAPAAGPGEAV